MKKCIIPILIILSAGVGCKKKNTLLPDRWYDLKRDSNEYVLYTPCEGITQYVDIKKNNIIIASQIEDPDTLRILNLQQIDDKGFIINCKGSHYSMLINIRWLNISHTTALWLFENKNPNYPKEFKQIMCPANKRSNFKLIECASNDSVKTPEKSFLPIEIK